jgi:N-acetylneuraminic acid mutarotase
MSGSNTVNAIGVYGTLGVASAGNVPGAREDAVSWTDKSGNFWLFGGLGFDSIGGPNGWLNDLWEFNPTTKEWTWMSGSNNYNASGVYGTLGTPSTNNVPGARYGAVSWTDLSGNFWLFGGEGYNSAGTFGNLNDLWEFSPTTKEWTWVSGSNASVPPITLREGENSLLAGLTAAAIFGSSGARGLVMISAISGSSAPQLRNGRG